VPPVQAYACLLLLNVFYLLLLSMLMSQLQYDDEGLIRRLVSGMGPGVWVWVRVSGFGSGSLGLGPGLWN
jgi:hypothetical protein